ncbi:hypothetical protein CHRY9393_01834 [Chryseobacterium fistulae]|nr:hypothetical protein CHRY9393_01834 [Chryseobacterium fistulae]
MNIKSFILCVSALLCALSCGKNNPNKNKNTKEVPVLEVKQKDTLISN